MSDAAYTTLLADLILVVHFAFVAFVVLGLVFVWIGHFLRLRSVRNFWFRALHILAMGVVVAEALFGVFCPLTTWESELRRQAGESGVYEESFMQHWIHKVLFFDLDPGTFTVIYSVFFLAMVLSLVFVPPGPPFSPAPKRGAANACENKESDRRDRRRT